jgi:hypothetical protein
MPRLTSPSARSTRRGLVAAALASTLVLAACGSSNSGNSSASVRQQAGLRFSECMRSHGVPNFPDPSGGGGGIQIQAGSGVNPQSPAFQAAQRTCFKFLPGGGPGHGQPSEARREQLLRLAECMRAHGVTSFPDPTSGPPSAPPSGGGIAFGSPGGFLSVPQALIQSPAFHQAASACGFPGGGHLKGAKSLP